MTCEDRLAGTVANWTDAERREFAEQFAEALTLELACGEGLPADYRRDLLRQECAKRSNAGAEEFLERVLGRLAYDDPLVALLGGANV